MLEKARATVAPGWCGKGQRGFRRQGKQVRKDPGHSEVGVSSAVPENNNRFSIYLQEGQSLEIQQHVSIQLNV